MKKYLLSFFVLGFMIAPNISLAVSVEDFSKYTIDQLVSLIEKLQKQLDSLRQNQVQCDIAEISLSLGDGEDLSQKDYVKSLQNLLKEKGFFTYHTATGYFGNITKGALVAFQKANGLEQNGVLDSATRAKIRTLKCQNNYLINKTEVQNKVEAKVKTEVKSTSGVVSSIQLKSLGANKVYWSTNGYSKNGFKIVWSKYSNPTYPTRDDDQYIYLSESSANSTELNAFDGTGTYYVRVCEYLGGSCGKYSNEIQVSL